MLQFSRVFMSVDQARFERIKLITPVLLLWLMKRNKFQVCCFVGDLFHTKKKNIFYNPATENLAYIMWKLRWDAVYITQF